MRVRKALSLCILIFAAVSCGDRPDPATAPTSNSQADLAAVALPIALPTAVPTDVPTATPGPEAYLLASLERPEIGAFGLTGHTGGIRLIEMSPDDRRAVAVSGDGTLKVWDLETGKVTLTLCAVQGVTCEYAILSVDPSASRALAVTPSDSDIEFIVLDLISGAMTASFSMPLDEEGTAFSLGVPGLRNVPGYPDPNLLVEFSDDGSRIFLYSVATGELTVYQASDGQKLLSFRPEVDSISAFGFSPDGRRAVTAPWEVDIEGLTDLEIEGQYFEHLTWDFVESYYIGLSLMAAEGMEVTAKQPEFIGGQLQVWDTETGELLRTLEGHSEPVFDIEFVGDRMLTASLNGTIRAWDLESGAEIYAIEAQGSPFLGDLKLTPRGTRVLLMVAPPDAESSAQVQVWDVANGQQVSTLEADDSYLAQDQWVLPISEDTAVGVDSHLTFVVWDLTTGERLREQEYGSVQAIAVTSDGMRAVTGDRYTNLELWDFENLSVLSTLESAHSEAVTSMAMLPDGRRLVTGAADASLRIWDIESGTELAALPVRGEVRAIALAPDGDTAAVLFDQHIEIWNLSSESLILSNEQVGGGSLDFTPDGAQILIASEYGQVTVIEAATGKIVNQIAISDRFADTRVHVLEGGEFVFVLNGGNPSVYDWRSGEQIAGFDLELGAGVQSNVSAASKDRTRVAFALYDYTFEVSHLFAMDFAGEGLAFAVSHLPEWIKSVAFTADGTRLLTGSSNSVRLWDLETGVELGVHEIDTGTVKEIAISPGGERALLLSGLEPLFATYSANDMIIIIDLAGWIEDLS